MQRYRLLAAAVFLLRGTQVGRTPGKVDVLAVDAQPRCRRTGAGWMEGGGICVCVRDRVTRKRELDMYMERKKGFRVSLELVTRLKVF